MMASNVFAFMVLCLCLATNAFMTPSFRSSRYIKSPSLKMSDAESNQGPDVWEPIRRRMKEDPSYDPLKDPEAMQQMQNALPTEFREFGNAMERLKVAFADAKGGVDGLDDLDVLAKTAAALPVSERLSSPQSKFFKEGAKKPEERGRKSLAQINELLDEIESEQMKPRN